MLVLGLGPALASVPTVAVVSGWISGWTGKADESRLPACCRRNGAHHCAMSEASSGHSHETFVTAPNTCPNMPRTLAATAPPIAAFLRSAPGSIRFEAAPQSLTADRKSVV